jgi:hypothetical protein
LKEGEISKHEEPEERPSETEPNPTQERIYDRDDRGRPVDVGLPGGGVELGSPGAADRRLAPEFDVNERHSAAVAQSRAARSQIAISARGVQKLDRHAAAAMSYSWMRPPSRSRLLT